MTFEDTRLQKTREWFSKRNTEGIIGTVLLRYGKPVWLKCRGPRVYLYRIQIIKPELRVMGRHWRVLSGSDMT